MGQTISYSLTQFEVDELIELSNGCFTQAEIEALYKRFRSLDRGRKGFITADELLSIPELSINPLSKRLAYFYDGINFREFVKMLAPYSSKATRDDKIRHLFAIWDVDGDGIVSKEDMDLIVRQAGGSTLTDNEVAAVVGRVFENAGAGEKGLDLPQFKSALERTPVGLLVEIPVGY
ncbi:putative Calcineurin subunit B type 2 [Nannochloris sp. 'desiccata']|nr:putative Calcineurin subunit B type 2 [Chlorella desiccata (nom. nud.)]